MAAPGTLAQWLPPCAIQSPRATIQGSHELEAVGNRLSRRMSIGTPLHLCKSRPAFPAPDHAIAANRAERRFGSGSSRDTSAPLVSFLSELRQLAPLPLPCPRIPLGGGENTPRGQTHPWGGPNTPLGGAKHTPGGGQTHPWGGSEHTPGGGGTHP